MPNEVKPKRRQHRLGISRKKPVKFNGKGWIYLNDRGDSVTIVYETEIDSAQKSKLEFNTDPAPHTDIVPGD